MLIPFSLVEEKEGLYRPDGRCGKRYGVMSDYVRVGHWLVDDI